MKSKYKHISFEQQFENTFLCIHNTTKKHLGKARLYGSEWIYVPFVRYDLNLAELLEIADFLKSKNP